MSEHDDGDDLLHRSAYEENGEMYKDLSPRQTYRIQSLHKKRYMLCLVFFFFLSVVLSVSVIIVVSVKRSDHLTCVWDTPGNKRIFVFGTFDAFVGDPEYLWEHEFYSYTRNISSWNKIVPALYRNGDVFSTLTANGQKRYGDRMSWIDIMTMTNDMNLVSPYVDGLLDLPSIVTSFAIEGAFAEGNVFDEDGDYNVGYQRLSSSPGFEDEVRDFLHVVGDHEFDQDGDVNMFIYSGVGYLDVIALSFEVGVDSIYANIQNSVRTHVRSISKLYDAGARRLLVIIADDLFFRQLPLVRKNIVNADLVDVIAREYLTSFYAEMVNATAAEMLMLDWTIVGYSDIVGIDNNITIYDYAGRHNGMFRKDLMFMDDLTLSETSMRYLYKYRIRPWIELAAGECRPRLT